MSHADRQDYFESVYRETFKRLSQYVFFKVAGFSEAEDVVASVYSDFYQYIVLKDKQPENTLAYLIKMANHELSRLYKDRQQLISLDNEVLNLAERITDEKDLETDIFEQFDLDALWQTLQLLSETDQQVLIAKFRFDMTFKEIALSLQQNESTVKLRYYRALDKLHKLLV